jgi:hypothetical protein
MQWDDVVDVVCTGSGPAGLAAATAAADAGLEVFVAESSVGPVAGMSLPPVESLPSRVIRDLTDWETSEFLHLLSQDLGPLSPCAQDLDVPIRIVEDDDPAPARVGRRLGVVPTFVGARLRDWATECLASPYGVLYSDVSDPSMTTVRAKSGETLEAAVIGAFDADTALNDWLIIQARDRGIDSYPASQLVRLVFVDGQVAGAVIDTAEGQFALGARYGVVMATAGFERDGATPRPSIPLEAPVQVCMVRQPASRFGRLEFLTRSTRPRLASSTARQSA